MSVPESLCTAVAETLRTHGDTGVVDEAIPTQDGHNCRSVRLTTTGGRYFLKWKIDAPDGQFLAEQRGLELLGQIGPARVPRCLYAAAPRGDVPGHILMEWIEMLPQQRYSALGAEFGELLAHFHRTAASLSDGRFGLGEPSFLSSREQDISWEETWPSFFVERRLAPEIERALRAKRIPPQRRRALENMCVQAEKTLAATRCWPVLLHGDLWRGNIRFDRARRLVLYDPAVYWGDREVDLATLASFDALPPGFQQAYDAVWPLSEGHAERRSIYTPHYLLVCLNGGAKVGARVDALLRHG